jgi:hypothetical protein
MTVTIDDPAKRMVIAEQEGAIARFPRRCGRFVYEERFHIINSYTNPISSLNLSVFSRD